MAEEQAEPFDCMVKCECGTRNLVPKGTLDLPMCSNPVHPHPLKAEVVLVEEAETKKPRKRRKIKR
jgi:hypothetical protein